MEIFGETITGATLFFLVLAVGLTLFFEAINGFHDTANAVATVIYTHSLKPVVAVVWSGIWNFIGVLLSTGAVAYSIVGLLPVELVINVGSGPSYAMVFSILIASIIWNFSTWYMGLPNSSSHTLIGAIMGVGLAHSLSVDHSFSEGINWKQVQQVFASLLVSPLIGFIGAALLLLLLKLLIHKPRLYSPADPNHTPPGWIRGLLILTCTGVSFAHGSNDGQKGMGLLMLILIGILPGIFSLNMEANAGQIARIAAESRAATQILNQYTPAIVLSHQEADKELANFLKQTGKVNDKTFAAITSENRDIAAKLDNKQNFKQLPMNERQSLRTDMYLVSSTIGKLNTQNKFTNPSHKQALANYQSMLNKETKFIPYFVKAMVAFALGIGTMIGWKRIVVTVGEKIGKQHLSYGQGASAEIVAMLTIEAADRFGLPVSTTHVLSSGVAGTMVANGNGLQGGTIRNIALAWVLTLPISTLLGSALFGAILYVLLHYIGVS